MRTRLLTCAALTLAMATSALAAIPSTRTTTRPTSRPTVARADHRVCFVVSSGGSMVSLFEVVRQDLRGGIDALRPDQSVGLFVAADGKANTPTAMGDGRLIPATPDAKAQLDSYVGGLISVGQTSLAAGLSAALATRPDVIWIVANGNDAKRDSPACLMVTRRLNAGHRTRINTLLRYGPDDEGRAFLYQLAHQNGGVCLDATGKRLTAPPPPMPPRNVDRSPARTPVNVFVEG